MVNGLWGILGGLAESIAHSSGSLFDSGAACSMRGPPFGDIVYSWNWGAMAWIGAHIIELSSIPKPYTAIHPEDEDQMQKSGVLQSLFGSCLNLRPICPPFPN